MQNVLATLTDKKNMIHNDWLKTRNDISTLSEQIEEIKHKQEKLLADEKEVDVAIGLIKGELDANAIGTTTRDKGQPVEADATPSEEPEPEEEPAPADDEVRPSEEPTPEHEPSKPNEEGETTSPVDTEQGDGKEGDSPVDGSDGKE